MINFTEQDLVDRKLECSYFDYGHKFDGYELIEFSCEIGVGIFLDRCAARIDEFIVDCKNEFTEDDEDDSTMVELRSLGFPSCDKLITSHPDLLRLIVKYIFLEVFSELMPVKVPCTGYLLYKIHDYSFRDGKFMLCGMASKKADR